MQGNEEKSQSPIKNTPDELPKFEKKINAQEINFANFGNEIFPEVNVTNVVGGEKNIKKKKMKFNPITAFVGVIIAAVVAAMTIISPAPVVSLKSDSVGGDYYAYHLMITNPDNIELTIKVYNDYFKSEQKTYGGEINNRVEGLRADTEYKIEVAGSSGIGAKTFYAEKFRTLK